MNEPKAKWSEPKRTEEGVEFEVEIPVEVEIPGPPTGYTDLIDSALLAKEKDSQSYYPLRPSSAGACGRKLAYELMQYKGFASYPREVKSAATIRLLALGNPIEQHSIRNFDLITKVDEEFKVKYRQQALSFFRLDPVGDELQGQLIEGSMDLAIMKSNTGGFLDVKSAKDKFSQSFKTKWDESTAKYNAMMTLIPISGTADLKDNTAWYAPDLEMFLEELKEPFFEDNFLQLNSYCCTDFAKEHGIDHGSIYRYCKNDSRHIEIRFKPSEKLYLKLKDKLNRVNKAVAQKKPELVKKDEVLGSMKCAWCPYAKLCWNEDALKAHFNTYEKKEWPTDIGKLKNQPLVDLFAAYESPDKKAAEAESIETAIKQYLVEAEVKKIKLDNGNVYELKYLKTPKPHFDLRRSKL